MVDAVGVTEHDRFEDRTQPLDRKPTVALKALLDLAAQGSTDPDLASTLASRLARLDRRLTPADRERLAQVAEGVDLTTITHGLVDASDPDRQRERAIELTGKAEPTPAEISAAAKELVSEALKPLAANPDLRTTILDLRKSYEQTIDETSKDVVLEAGLLGGGAGAGKGNGEVLQGVHRGTPRRHPCLAGALQRSLRGATHLPRCQGARRDTVTAAAQLDAGPALGCL